MKVVSKETLHQTLAIAAISLNMLLNGIVDGWTAPTINRLKQTSSDLKLTIDESSWIASASQMGLIFGSAITALLLDIVGRKPVTICCALLYLLLWLGVTVCSTVWLISFMRFLLGTVSGANAGVDVFYLGEVTSSSLRVVFGTLFLCLYYTGVCAEYVAVTYLSYQATALLNTALALCALISTIWMVESPHYLLLKGNHKHALRNFLYLKGVPDLGPYDDEFQRIKHNVDFERTKITYKSALTSPLNRRALLIVVLLQTLAFSTGYGPVMSYSSSLFASTETISQNEFTIIFGVFQLVFSLLAVLFIRRYNKRLILRAAYCFVAVNHLCTAGLFYINEKATPVAHFPWLIFASVNTYVCVIALAYPAIYTYRGELLPLSVKALGGFMVTVCRGAVNFVLILLFLRISRGYGTHVNFIMYSVTSVLLVVFLYFCVPETRNKSLTQIQDNLHCMEERGTTKNDDASV